ncbi:MAG: hypothetical protein JNK65_07720 [Deltaproteobacteria bacterium]|nr:hypothetical protein [Deltaproteobacteria bacterium]
MKRSVITFLVCVLFLVGCKAGDHDEYILNESSDVQNTQPNVPQPISSSCGDKVVDQGEQCDNGSSNSDIEANACRTTCKKPSCGDGAIDSGEECDAGSSNANLPNQCRTSCKLPVCGDGIVDTGEACDGGSNCDSSCNLVNSNQCVEYVIQQQGGCNIDSQCNTSEVCAQQSSSPRKCVTQFNCSTDADCLVSVTQCSFRMFCIAGVCR